MSIRKDKSDNNNYESVPDSAAEHPGTTFEAIVERIRTEADETKRVNLTYGFFNEETRLSHSKAAQVEFLTVTRMINRYLKPGMRILDIGAGAGAYSLHYAAQGFDVDAIELADNNIAAFQKNISPGLSVQLRKGNALDLGAYESDAYDIVLCMGPLYHLRSAEDRSTCIRNAMRVCKEDGLIFFAFIGHDMVFMTELMNDAHYFRTGDYDHDTMRLHNFPFEFFTVEESRKMLEEEGIHIMHSVATDGMSELMADRINNLSDEEYVQYLKWHEMVCEKPEALGMSNHLLFVGRKHT